MDKAWLYFKDILIMILGLLAFSTGTYFALYGIIDKLSQGDAAEETLLLADVIQSSSVSISNVTSLVDSFTRSINNNDNNMTTMSTMISTAAYNIQYNNSQ